MEGKHSYERSSSEVATSPGANLAGNDVPKGRDSISLKPNSTKESDGASVAYDNVVQSDIGVNTLLTRLKQSIASARDFAIFLKKRSTIEEDHAQALKKLTKTAFDSTRRPDSRQGSFSKNYEDITRIHDRMADNGIQFALSLHQMHEDLTELSADKEKGRKTWKANGLNAEKRVQDAESAMEKAKAKYNSLAEDYDRARTGDKQSGRFGLKGPKSAAQVEEDLHRKMQAADADYSSKVQAAQSQRHELVTTLRPQTIKALEAIIRECDSGLTLQMQKFATFNERLLLGNGICVAPLDEQSANSQGARSLREIVSQIDNEQDLKSYVTGYSTKVGPKQHDLEYRKHPTLQTTGPPQPQNAQNAPVPAKAPTIPSGPQAQSFGPLGGNSIDSNQPLQAPPAFNASQTGPGSSDSLPGPMQPQSQHVTSFTSEHGNTYQPQSGPPHVTGAIPFARGVDSFPKANAAPYGSSSEPAASPTKPVFGISLEDLFQRDGSAVPMVVYQCLQAVDMFGLDVEGIYRLSGSASHISQLRSMFDRDATQVDFRNPESFMHDVNSVAGLMKQFFRDLPDPLLTKEHYQSFIDAARIDDDITRRDSLHATINSLPDPNYATLRALTLHLHRVQEHSSTNRMTSANLAICFGPTLMVSGSPPAIADAGWQVRVVDTILQNTYQIFDED